MYRHDLLDNLHLETNLSQLTFLEYSILIYLVIKRL